MDILFKCDDYVYYINCDKIISIPLDECPHFDEISNIKHLKDCQPICKLIEKNGYTFDAYYIHNNDNIILKSIYRGFFINKIFDDDKLDYTEVNINKLKDENII